jgi:hypothetical protein
MEGHDMKRGPVVFGALASGLMVAHGVPVFAQDFDRTAGFIRDPSDHKSFAYLTAFSSKTPAGQTTLRADISVSLPANGGVQLKQSVVGVIEHIAGNAVDAWLSQENTFILKTAQQQANKTGLDTVTGSYTTYEYNQGSKTWTSSSGSMSFSPKAVIDLDLNPVAVKNGIDILVYKIAVRKA